MKYGIIDHTGRAVRIYDRLTDSPKSQSILLRDYAINLEELILVLSKKLDELEKKTMNQTVYNSDFHDAFKEMGREYNFSYEGREALFKYLEEVEEATGTEIELDVIALCCDYNEATWQEIANDYSIEIEEDADEEESIDAVRDYLNDNTNIVGEFNGTFVFAAF